MDKRSSFIIAGIIAAGLCFMIYASLQSNDVVMPSSQSVASSSDWEHATATMPEMHVTEKTVVTAKHAYLNGEHILAGEIPLPTPCHILDVKAIATDKKHITVVLNSSIKTGETCEASIVPARFKVSIKGDKSAKINATLNGIAVVLNLIEASPGEDLDNFELYLKG